MNVLLVGYGSIGKRHESVLKELNTTLNIDIVTQQTIDNKTTFSTLESVEDLNKYDYFIIASATSKHYEQLKYLEQSVSNKVVFCEKPLFENYKDLKVSKNIFVVGYVLRFHPLLQKLKQLLKKETILNINAKCGSYLPSWRKDRDYKKSYSAKRDEGGGVLLDLSHELDYIQWLCGEVIEVKSYQLHISELEIDSDDIVIAIGKTSQNTLVNLSIDYFSKLSHRFLFIDTDEKSFKLDLITNILTIGYKDGTIETIEIELERNDMFRLMHQSALSHRKYICSYEEAQNTMSLITKIQGQNDE